MQFSLFISCDESISAARITVFALFSVLVSRVKLITSLLKQNDKKDKLKAEQAVKSQSWRPP